MGAIRATRLDKGPEHILAPGLYLSKGNKKVVLYFGRMELTFRDNPGSLNPFYAEDTKFFISFR